MRVNTNIREVCHIEETNSPLANLDIADCETVSVPRVAASPAALECKLWKIVELPKPDDADAGIMVVGTIAGIPYRQYGYQRWGRSMLRRLSAVGASWLHGLCSHYQCVFYEAPKRKITKHCVATPLYQRSMQLSVMLVIYPFRPSFLKTQFQYPIFGLGLWFPVSKMPDSIF